MSQTSQPGPAGQPESEPSSRLAAFGLGNKQARSWAFYDWANSAFATTVMAVVLPIYYVDVAGKGLEQASAYWAYTTALALSIIAVLSPILGAVADHLGAKKRFMGAFVALGVIFSASLYLVHEGDWLLASGLFIMANIGFAGANVFYDSLLAHVAEDDQVDRLSASGYALGYMGGGILLVLNLIWILNPESWGFADAGAATRASLVSVAVWWAIFSVPLFRDVPEPATGDHSSERDKHAGDNPIFAGFKRLGRTFREIRQFPDLMIFLIAFLIYNDGIGTIIKMAAAFATELDMPQQDVIGALVLTQFAGIPFALAFGRIAERIGVKRGILLALTGYTIIAIFGYFITLPWHFWALAFCVAMVQGGSQALSRSLFSSLVPKSRSSEFFGFFSVSGKFAGIFGPLLYGLIAQATGNIRLSILSLIVFFIVGMLLLKRVDVERGKAAALAAELA